MIYHRAPPRRVLGILEGFVREVQGYRAIRPLSRRALRAKGEEKNPPPGGLGASPAESKAAAIWVMRIDKST